MGGTFAATGPMAHERGWHRALGSHDAPWAMTLRDGSVLVTGGSTDTDTARSREPDIYDPTAGTFRTGPDKEGGTSPTWTLNSYQPALNFARFDPAPGTWSDLVMIQYAPPGGSAVVLVDGEVLGHGVYLVSGGTILAVNLDAAAQRTPDGSVDGRAEVPSLVARYRRVPSATLLTDGRILVAGGIDFPDQAGRVLADAELVMPGP